ncbi:HBL089Wp [Eremothecium sinecaudum]|uniref:Ribosome biogenesis protein SLX9 n=1 Tax=Eremothecium sinecaudum TaxID=45286 RepID=A0A109UWE8_9SACH|nr:HBL089Wp [Eremothecium sinecaudum]AMD18813.1 HBL089Wp [Eremothecium sinecaudum]
MVAKKRTKLRSKVAKLSTSEKPLGIECDEKEFPEDPKAFLHQYRESKKEKSVAKSQSFLNRIREQATGNVGISKSSLRRRKKKLKNDLKPKMEDLLTSLKQEGVLDDAGDVITIEDTAESASKVTKIVTSAKYASLQGQQNSEPGQVVIKRNEPSIRTQKGARKLGREETARFSKVITDKTFQNNPFAALREVIIARGNGSF